MFQVEQTSLFKRWLAGLRDQNAYTRVRMQLLRFGRGQFGDVKPVGEAFWKHGFILDQATAFIFAGAARRSFCCSLAATKAHNQQTFGKRLR